jgi:sRNA-binding protein
MPSLRYRAERDRGISESPQQLAALREKWPVAFPATDQDVRPLAIGAPREVAAAMDWSLPYTLGVLAAWKMEPVYCRAILAYDQRIALDGSPAEVVEIKARDLATKHLAQIAKGKRAKKSAKAIVAPKPLPPTPEQLRARVRSSLLRRSA